MRFTTLTAATALLALCGVASADIIEYNFYLSGEQEVPPNDTHAVGAAQLLYDTDDQTFDLDIMVFGIALDDLLGVGPNNSPVHIHMAPPGSNGPIVIDLGFISSFVDDGQGIRYQVSGELFGGTYGDISSDPNDNEAALFAGNLYVNIHTEDYPSGELRGQIVPTPATFTLAGIAGLIALRRRRA